AHREHPHFQTLLILGQRHVATATPFPLIVGTALCNQAARFRVQFELDAERLRGRLTGSVVWGGADSTTTKYYVGGGETTLQYRRDLVLIVRDDLHTVQLHAPFGKELN